MDKKNTEHTIQGNILVSGSGQGKALVLSEPLSLWGGLDPDTGEIIDRRHPQSGDVVTDRILVLPSGRGSSSASSILLEAIRAGTAPAAIILQEKDGILALGAAVAKELYGTAPPVIVVCPETYSQICDGDPIRIIEGTISVSANLDQVPFQ